MSTPVLSTEDLQFAHDDVAKWSFPDIEIHPGEKFVILGQSGSGKTTLLHLLCGLLPAGAGIIKLNGIALHSLSSARVDLLRGSEVGLIFQKPHFIQSINVFDNIALAAKLGGSNQPSTDHIDRLLAELNISSLKLKHTVQLSEGEKQRVGIARALANQPSIILADEPTSALDDSNCTSVMQLLLKMTRAHGCGLIVVTHDERIKSFFDRQITIAPPC